MLSFPLLEFRLFHSGASIFPANRTSFTDAFTKRILARFIVSDKAKLISPTLFDVSDFVEPGLFPHCPFHLSLSLSSISTFILSLFSPEGASL